MIFGFKGIVYEVVSILLFERVLNTTLSFALSSADLFFPTKLQVPVSFIIEFTLASNPDPEKSIERSMSLL